MENNVVHSERLYREEILFRRTQPEEPTFLVKGSDDLPIKKTILFENMFRQVIPVLKEEDFKPLYEKKNGKSIYIEEPVHYIGKLRRFGSLNKIYYSRNRDAFLVISYEYRWQKPKLGDLEGFGWFTISQFADYMEVKHIFKLLQKLIIEINNNWCFENCEAQTDLYFIRKHLPTEE